MNESSVSSAFQTKLRAALPGSVVIKHADKSMIGCLDASVTENRKTLWLEYKFIGPNTKGVTAEFMHTGKWSALAVAEASPTQFEMAKKLSAAGHALYLFWVLDHEAVRKKIKRVVLWHPLAEVGVNLEDTDEVVLRICQFFYPERSQVPKPIEAIFSNFSR